MACILPASISILYSSTIKSNKNCGKSFSESFSCKAVAISNGDSYNSSSLVKSARYSLIAGYFSLSTNFAISLTFSNVTDQIEDVNGDLQEKFNTITKYFTFNIDGLTIGQTDSPYKVVIDNDRFSMLVNDVEVLWLADGEVYTPEIEITRKMNLFGFHLEKDESGNVNCEYIGGGA